MPGRKASSQAEMGWVLCLDPILWVAQGGRKNFFVCSPPCRGQKNIRSGSHKDQELEDSIVDL